MKRTLMTAAAACALSLAAGCASLGMDVEAPATPTADAAPVAAPPVTAEAAAAFVADAEARLAALSEEAARIQWTRATNITHDTMWLESRINAEYTELQVELANGAAAFNEVEVPADVRRKLNLLRLGIVLPAPNKPGAAAELAEITTRLDSTYATGKFEFKGRQITLDEATILMAESRDPAELEALYEGWRTISPVMADDYARMVEIANEGARELGFDDTGAMWRAGYDMEPDAFAAETDRLWEQVKPFYENLHCYVRNRLNAKYGDEVQPATGPIRADLLGNMWSQQWGNIYDVVAPTTGGESSYDLTQLLVSKGFDAEKMVRTGENFYVSMGLAPLPQTFWERSMITRPEGREVVCHASAWDLDNEEDIRIKMCTQVNGDDFYTVHHELGHNYYQRAYKDQPFLFKNGANDGFHEAIGDAVALSVTPDYLVKAGLLAQAPGPEGDLEFLMRMALDRVAFLPFGLLVDQWRWKVFSGEVPPEKYNAAWWDLRRRYQNVAPPVARSEADFDPGAKYHVPGNVSYTRYFLAHILQFQFHRAMCRAAGYTGPLHRCSVYGNKQAGAKLAKMLEMGQSRPWPDALEALTGERRIDATALLEYFAPLNDWLVQQAPGAAPAAAPTADAPAGPRSD